MDKRQSLIILIQNSYILSQLTKDKLVARVEKMTDEEVEDWGQLFSQEQTFVAENKEKILAQVNAL